MSIFGQGGFDAGAVPKGDEAIPADTQCACVVTEWSEHDTKAGDGKYLKLTIEVLEGPFKGRKIWPTFNLVNPNEDAVRIAKQQLASLCLAVGVPHPNSADELRNIPVRVTFGKPRDWDGGQQSNIKKYATCGGAAGTVSGLAPATAQGTKPAWAK